ncbi:MAG: BMP family ABC transporter substrate-binding protein [Rhizobiaceae bacterium]|nr:BMP family ABC transporter substrate-binding protein [Rhizobiaceae bacterium]
MKLRSPLLAIAISVAASVQPAFAQDFTVWAPFSSPLGDRSFIDSANRGVERAAAERGVKIKVIPASANDPSAWDRNLREAASASEVNLVVTGGTLISSTLEAVAPEFPDQKFVIFDAPSSAANVTGITYAQNEGAFLAGAVAALITKNPEKFPKAKGSNKVGLVTGIDIPVIRDFIKGFESGVKHVDPAIVVDVRFTNDFGSPQKGFDTATAVFRDGADVVYQVAGPTGLGVLRAAESEGRYGIGQDSDQNDLHPGFIAASAIKHVDNTIFQAISDAMDGKLEMGQTRVGNLANGGVDIALAGNVIPAEIAAQIEEIRKQIVSGAVVPDGEFK